MQEKNIKNNKLSFAALYVVSLLLMLFIFLGFVNSKPPESKTVENTGDQQLLVVDHILHERLTELQEADKTILLSIDSSDISNENINKRNLIEERFKNTIDSLQNNPVKQAGSRQNEQLNNILAYFMGAFRDHVLTREALNKRSTVESPDSLAYRDELIKMQEDLKSKDMKIAGLVNLLNQKQPANLKSNAGADNTDLAKRNERLSSALNSLENKNALLTRQYNAVKQQNSLLNSQLNNSRGSIKNK